MARLSDAEKAYRRRYWAKHSRRLNDRKASDAKRKQRYVARVKARLGCKHCAEKHPAALAWHHRDSTTKRQAVARLILRNASLETIKAEIRKCDCLCHNCHAKLHAAEREQG